MGLMLKEDNKDPRVASVAKFVEKLVVSLFAL